MKEECPARLTSRTGYRLKAGMTEDGVGAAPALPSSSPRPNETGSPSNRRHRPPIDHKLRARDASRAVGGEEGDEVGDFFRG